MRDYPLVIVEWEDSSQPIPAWQFRDDISVAVVRISSVGWLLKRDTGVLALAPNVGGLDGGAAPQCSGVIAIPARAVLSVELLGEAEPRAALRRTPRGGTIQECVLKVLADTPDGLHINDLVDAIHPLYGRRLARVSVSPQLSRLKYLGKVELRDGLWFATNAIAAAARQGGDGTAPAESPQSGAESASPEQHRLSPSQPSKG